MNYEPFYCSDTTTVDDVVEHILIRLNSDYAGGCLDVSEFCHRNQKGYTDKILEVNVRTKMYEHRVATPCLGVGQPDTAVALTAKGSRFAQKGDWKGYLQALRQDQAREQTEKVLDRKRQDEAHHATLVASRATVDSAKSAKSSARAAWVAGTLAAIPIVISIIQYIDSRSTNAEINALKSQIELLSRQLQAQKANHKETPYQADSLPTLQRKKK